jgi:hypothetical protein
MALLALLPDIFMAVKKIKSLFGESKKKLETVTGRTSIARTPEELQKEVSELPPEDQEKWIDLMQAEISRYYAENERLDIETGRITPELQASVSTAAADKITVLRQTTRPWAVRMAIHYVFFPVYLLIFDVLQLSVGAWLNIPQTRVFRAFEYVFGASSSRSAIDKIGDLLVQGSYTLAGQLYMSSIGWVASIVISYMGLREIGKFNGSADVNMAGKSGQVLGGIVSGIGKFFKK